MSNVIRVCIVQIVVCLMLAAVASAGLLPAFHPAPAVVAASVVPVAHAPVATSYANTYKVSVKAAPVVPVVPAAPVVPVHSAPLVPVHPAPIVHGLHY